MALLCGLCEVVFDVDAGNQVQHVLPAGAFSEQELADIAFSSFPDSMSMELSSRSAVRDSCFSFRLRRRRGAARAAPDAPEAAAAGPAPHPLYLFGHVFCRQRHDDRLRRGCEQKSVVLLSHLPLPGALELLARVVGPAALSARERCADVLHQVLEEVLRWPPLEWGGHADLPLLGLPLPLSVQLPMLTTLPADALPAAVAAALGRDQQWRHLEQRHGQQQQQHGEDGAPYGQHLPAAQIAGKEAGAAAGADADTAPDAAAAAAPAAAAGIGAAVALEHAALAAHDAAASPAQVAAALADELDGSGLPLCLLPQAYGQQELEPGPFGDCDCYTPLRGCLQQLWGLWELLLLGEPLMVAAPSPGACSAAVSALLSLLAPFPFSLDYRPYYTIHDASFARLAAGEAPTAANGLPIVLGITNLYLVKALPSWPNVLSTGYTSATLAPSSSSDRLEEAAAASSGNGGSANGSAHGGSSGLQPSESAASLGSSVGGLGGGGGGLGGSRAPSSTGSWLGGTLRRTPASPAVLLSGPVDHCWLSYRPCSRPDRAVLDRLVQPQPTDPADKWRRLAAVNSTILRRHFQELTKALLFPLLRWITPAQPPAQPAGQNADPKAAEAAAAAARPPPLPAVDPEALLEELGGRDAVMPEILVQRFGQRGLLAFYARFLRSPALAAALRTWRLAAEEWQRQEWAAAAAAAAAPMRELLAVEAFFRAERQLSAVRVQLATAAGGGPEEEAAALARQLEAQLRLAFEGLPADLQAAILATPSHAALLGPACEQAAAAAGAAAEGPPGGAAVDA